MPNATLTKFLCAAALAALLLISPWTYRTLCAQAAGPAPEPPVDGSTTTTLNDQSDLAVTVYNSELALVRDVRQINLAAGESRLRFMDIAASVNPATASWIAS